jgi:hypothetical protein
LLVALVLFARGGVLPLLDALWRRIRGRSGGGA